MRRAKPEEEEEEEEAFPGVINLYILGIALNWVARLIITIITIIKTSAEKEER
jgi:hypothetical protein